MLPTINKIFTFYVLGGVVLSLIFSSYVQADLFETAFQQSKNLDQVVNIGNSKNAVGNEIFRGSTSLNIGLGILNGCYVVLPNTQANCKQGAQRKDNKCYQVPFLANADQSNCISKAGERRKLTYIDTIKRESLLVRITKTLLRITIALSIPMIIFLGIKTIMAAMNGGEYKESLKNVGIVVAGLVLALSAIGIIYFIQSLTLQSLSGAPSPF